MLVASPYDKHANDWSPDGQFLMYDEHVAGRAQDLLLIRRDGGAPIPFLTTEADETFGQFSRDGKWIAYRSTESSRSEVFVRDFRPERTPPYGAEKIQISVAGGDKPRWSRDGREIFFLQGTSLMAVPFKTGTPPTVGVPVKLFEFRPNSFVPYDVMPDGSFIVNVQTESAQPVPAALRVMVNWEAMLSK
jgi:Tol biopolymer transport system component